ncbi:MAG: c-type cytochrome [Kiritimatiellae bacterium]|nr:c-type cytochrome [Kiritimatiellia bacterium]
MCGSFNRIWPQRVLFLVVMVGLPLYATAEAVTAAQWGRSIDISINGYQGSSSLSDFPVLVSLNPTAIPGLDYHDFNAQGSDLRFTDSANAILLEHEIELWNTNGISRIWVRVPHLASSCVIKAFWKNTAASAQPSSATWESGFSGVWHLADNLDDSTPNRNNGVNAGSVKTDGAVAGGRAFDGNDFIDCGNADSLNLANNQLTLSAWIKPNTLSGNCIVSKSYSAAHTSPYYTWVLYAANAQLHSRIDVTSASRGALSVGLWQHVAAVYNGTGVSLYIDGGLAGSFAKTGNLLQSARNVRIGGRHTSALAEFFDGAIDEVRISSVARSADWIEAEHDTVVNPAFCTFAEPVDLTVPRLWISDAQCVEGNTGTTQMVFQVMLSIAATNPVTFHYATTYGSADAVDLQLAQGDLIIPAGETRAQIALTVNGDTDQETDEFVFVDLSAVNGAELYKSRGHGLILDDDRTNPLSPLALAADVVRHRLYVARHADLSIAVIDTTRNSLIQAFSLPEAPNSLTLSADGTTLYAAAGAADGHIYVLNAGDGAILQTIAAGHTPLAPLLSPDETTLYVCNRFDDDVSVVDLSEGATLARIPVARQPHAMALTPDGARLFVAEHLPAGPATNSTSAGAVAIIDPVSQTLVKRITLPPGSQSLRGLCIAADGSKVYVTHLISHFQIPTTQVLRGWMNTAALSVIDTASESLINTVLLDDLDLGAANPWGVICSADNKFLCIAHAGTHEVSVIDQAALLSKLQSGDANTALDFTYLLDLRRRLPLKGNGPRGLALVGNKLYAAQYFSDTIGVVDITPGNEYSAHEIQAGLPRAADAFLRGERNFNDAKLCLQQWQSCASCHPDTRADALNWDLMNDGFGNPKNTKSLLYSIQTPPSMSTGIRKKAQVAVRAGLKYIQFVNQPESCAEDIDTYLTILQAQPSPYLVNGSLSDAAVRGQALFGTQNCTGCHSGEYFTDGKLHDVGSGIGGNTGVRFDTPTLRELWRTGPYLHDGRIDNVRDVVTDIHSRRVSALTPAEIDDLVEYLLSL